MSSADSTVLAGDLQEGDLLHVAGGLITVGRCQQRHATRTNPARMAVYPLRPDGTVDRDVAVLCSVRKRVRLDPASPRYQEEK